MGPDLLKLKEQELRKFSYADTKAIVVALEGAKVSDLETIDGLERIETYLSFVKIITNRIENDEFEELCGEEQNVRSDRELLNQRLSYLQLNFKLILEMLSLRKRVTERDQKYDSDISKIQNDLEKTIVDYTEKKNEIESNLKDQVHSLQHQLDNSEHSMLTHVLTLMGVFSAVVTIIMSIVVTSSSWLNGADSSSAIVAFSIPNLVSVLAVIVLMTMVFVYHNAINGFSSFEKKSALIFFGATFFVVLSLSVVIGMSSISHTNATKASHICYVISPSEYVIVGDSSDSDEGLRYIEFWKDSQKYSFSYGEEYIHDEGLFFCVEHCTLE